MATPPSKGMGRPVCPPSGSTSPSAKQQGKGKKVKKPKK